jgi:CubicO group peptidase (beta-lactamase class C family)
MIDTIASTRSHGVQRTFYWMKIMKTMLSLLLLLCAVSVCPAADISSRKLPRSSPEKQGIASSAILEFIDAADEKIDTMNSFMLVRHGHVVAEGWWTPYDATSPHMLFSLSKSFTSTAVGLAIADGKLTLDDEVMKFFPEDAPTDPSANLKAMRVRDLLCMSAGHQAEVSLSDSKETWTKAFLNHPVPHKPGTHFLYNTPATYMLSAIVQKVTGMTVLDYLRPRLFEPLGIENPQWETSPQGISLGGYGLSVRTEDIARFGQLYLQKGVWMGKRLIPSAWIDTATMRQTSSGSNPKSDWEQGYGYQFWRCRHGLYRGDGAFGQFCIVMPEQDAVVAITSGGRDMQAVMNLVWEKLLPALKAAPLPADGSGAEKLGKRLASLAVRPVTGQATSPRAAAISGKRYVFASNYRQIDAVTLESGKNGATVVVSTPQGESRIVCEPGVWKKGRAPFVNGVGGRMVASSEQPIAASGGWTRDDTFTLKLCLYETPFYSTMVFRFNGDRLLLDSEHNVSFGSTALTALPQLAGEARQAN